MTKKIFYLLLALALPGLIFIFLKLFGKNHFDIPVYYKEGVSDLPTECRGAYHGQYVVPDSILKTIGWKNGDALLVVGATEREQIELAKIQNKTKENSLQIISLDNLEPTRLKILQDCVLFLKDPFDVVLIDKQKRIRGYFALNSREEIDRLEVETEILLTNN